MVLKSRIYERLAEALRAEATDTRYAYLPAAEKKQIVAILRETDAELPAYYPAR